MHHRGAARRLALPTLVAIASIAYANVLAGAHVANGERLRVQDFVERRVLDAEQANGTTDVPDGSVVVGTPTGVGRMQWTLHPAGLATSPDLFLTIVGDRIALAGAGSSVRVTAGRWSTTIVPADLAPDGGAPDAGAQFVLAMALPPEVASAYRFRLPPSACAATCRIRVVVDAGSWRIARVALATFAENEDPPSVR